jgi:quercetin dioxygenase-like cupin family protein
VTATAVFRQDSGVANIHSAAEVSSVSKATKRLLIWAATVSALSLTAPVGAALAQSPPQPIPVFESRFDTLEQAAEIELIQRVIEFAPGAGSPPHRPGGHLLVTVLEGEMMLRRGGAVARFTEGQSWREEPGEVDEPFNDSPTRARILLSALVPKGASLVIFQGTESSGSPRPFSASIFDSRFQVPKPAAALTVVQQILDVAPGARTAPRAHTGPAMFLVLDGELMLHSDGPERRFTAGQSWVEELGQVYSLVSLTPGATRVAVTLLVPQGAELTVLEPPAAAAPAAPCVFARGFAALREQIITTDSDQVGACLEDEHGTIDPATRRPLNLDTVQRTTGGLLVWDQRTNSTRFSNGFQTWTESACGLQTRLNSETFVWETNPGIGVEMEAATDTCAVI